MRLNSQQLKAKTIQSLLLLIGAIQCLFVGAIIYEHSQRLEVWVFVLLFALLLGYVLRSRKKSIPVDFDSWKISVWVFFGALATLGLRELGMGIVLSAASMGVLGSLPSYVLKNSSYWKQVSMAIYCGAFIGMSNVTIDPVFSLLASGITAVLFSFSKPLLHGVGGKLGTLAFIGVVFAYGIHFGLGWI